MTLSFTTPGRFIPTLSLTVCLPPRSFLPLQVKLTGQPRLLYVRAERASLPLHASDMLSARLQAIGGARTLTSQDSQHCRLLPLLAAKLADQLGAHVGELELFSQHLRTTRTEQQRLVVAGDQDRTPPDFSANVKQEIHRPFGMAVGDVPDILSLAIAREECSRSPTAGHGVHGHSQSAEAAQDAKSTVACRLDSPQHDNRG